MKTAASPIAGTETVVIRRTIDATPEQVFQAWVDPQMIEEWWGPEGFRSTVEFLDLRVGGAFRFAMLSPTGSEGGTAGIILEMDPPRRLVFEMTEHCNCDLPPDADAQLESAIVAVDFVSKGSSTEVVVEHTGLSSAAIGGRINDGWTSSLSRLGGRRYAEPTAS